MSCSAAYNRPCRRRNFKKSSLLAIFSSKFSNFTFTLHFPKCKPSVNRTYVRIPLKAAAPVPSVYGQDCSVKRTRPYMQKFWEQEGRPHPMYMIPRISCFELKKEKFLGMMYKKNYFLIALVSTGWEPLRRMLTIVRDIKFDNMSHFIIKTKILS